MNNRRPQQYKIRQFKWHIFSFISMCHGCLYVTAKYKCEKPSSLYISKMISGRSCSQMSLQPLRCHKEHKKWCTEYSAIIISLWNNLFFCLCRYCTKQCCGDSRENSNTWKVTVAFYSNAVIILLASEIHLKACGSDESAEKSCRISHLGGKGGGVSSITMWDKL